MIFVTMLVSVGVGEFSVIRLTTRCDKPDDLRVPYGEMKHKLFIFKQFRTTIAQRVNCVRNLGDVRWHSL